MEDNLEELADGASADLTAYAKEIAKDLVAATTQGRGDLVAHLIRQTRMLAEKHRIRMNRAAQATFKKVLAIAARTIRAMIGAAL